MEKIIGIGNALVDVLLHLDSDKALSDLHLAKGSMQLIGADEAARLSQAIATREHEVATGGSAANTIMALALLGDAPGLLGCIGHDAMGHYLVSRAAERGIDARFVQLPDQPTGVATTFITPDGERTFATHLGAAAMLEPAMLNAQQLEGYGIVHVEGYLVQNHALMEHLLQMAKGAGLQVSYDLASYNVVRDDLDFIRHITAHYVDIVFANSEEAAAFSLQSDPEVALRELADLTGTAVVKLGSKGAIGMWRDDAGTFQRADAATISGIKVVDTTAAGDFFAAGFLHGLTTGCDLATCLSLGNHLAAEVIQVTGTAVSAPQLLQATRLATRHQQV